MNCRDNDPKYNCGQRQNANCVFYEGYLPDFSELKDENCVTIKETTEELYKKQEEFLKDIDLKELGKKCVDYSTFKKSTVLKLNEALLALEAKVCEHTKQIENGSTITDISKLNLKCLQEECTPTSLTELQLLQLIIDKLCALEQRLTPTGQLG